MEGALGSIHVATNPVDTLFLLCIALAHLGYAFFGSANRRPPRDHFVFEARGQPVLRPSASSSQPSTGAPRIRTMRRSSYIGLQPRSSRRERDPRRALLNRLTLIGAMVGILVGIFRAADSGGIHAIPLFGIGLAVVARVSAWAVLSVFGD